MQIKELVTYDLLTVGPAHTLRQAAQLMASRNVGAAVVLTETGPGIFSERDLLRAVCEGVDPDEATVGDHMSWNLIVATSSWDSVAAGRTMVERHVRHLVVIDGPEEVGILSIRDLFAALLKELD